MFFCGVGTCPSGLSWADKARDENVAHSSATCSDRGVCNFKKVNLVRDLNS